MRIVKLFFLLLSAVNTHSKVLSWSFDNLPSLMLTDRAGVINSNNAVMSSGSAGIHQIRIEDIVLDSECSFADMFARFDKYRYTSFVRVKILDTFTDEELGSYDMFEQGSVDISEISASMIYMVVELHGEDIELRSAGVQMIEQRILSPNQLTINKDIIVANKDNLMVTVALNEAAKINLILYDRDGNISKDFASNKTLDKGTYRFYLDPSKLSFDYMGDKRYYVWLKADNLRSQPVEIIKKLLILPD